MGSLILSIAEKYIPQIILVTTARGIQAFAAFVCNIRAKKLKSLSFYKKRRGHIMRMLLTVIYNIFKKWTIQIWVLRSL